MPSRSSGKSLRAHNFLATLARHIVLPDCRHCRPMPWKPSVLPHHMVDDEMWEWRRAWTCHDPRRMRVPHEHATWP
eukprot:7016612-Pyramimonas_sp.AAC.1